MENTFKVAFISCFVSLVLVIILMLFASVHDALQCKDEFGYYDCKEQRTKQIELRMKSE